MRVTHVVPQIQQEASGPSYSVRRLCQSIARCGIDVELKCLAAGGPVSGVQLSLYRQWPVLSRFEVSTELAFALRQTARGADIVHNHSLWSMVNVAAGCIVPGHHAKLVTSPRGTLSSWALHRRKHVKQLMWPLQKRALVQADLLHATCDAEYVDIRRLGLAAPVAVIPNGIDVPPEFPDKPRSVARTLLYLGRIHPIKGIDELMHAWHELEANHSDWRLIIAGPGETAHVEHVKQLAKTLALQNVTFPGPVYGASKQHMYRNADLFVLPSHSENFGMVVAEALAHGCPAVVSTAAPWRGLEVEKAGWWINNDVATIHDTLHDAMNMPVESLRAAGRRGRDWMMRDFSWASIGERMGEAYHWLLEGGRQPACVTLD